MSQAHAGAEASSSGGIVPFEGFDQIAWMRENRPNHQERFSRGPLPAIGDANPFDAAFAVYLQSQANFASGQGHAAIAGNFDTTAQDFSTFDTTGIVPSQSNGLNIPPPTHTANEPSIGSFDRGTMDHVAGPYDGQAIGHASQHMLRPQLATDGPGNMYNSAHVSGNVNTHPALRYDNTQYGSPYSNFRPTSPSQHINDGVPRLVANQTGAIGQVPARIEAGGCAVISGPLPYVQGRTNLQTASAFGQAQPSYQTQMEQLPMFHPIAPRQPMYQHQVNGAQMQTRDAIQCTPQSPGSHLGAASSGTQSINDRGQDIRKARPAFASPRAPFQRDGGRVAAPKQTRAISIDRVEDSAILDTQNVNTTALEFYGYFTDEEKADIIKKRKQAKADAKKLTTGDERSNINNALRITVEGAPETPLRIKSLEHAYLVVEQRMPLSELARAGPLLKSMETNKQKIVNFFVRCLNADIVSVPDDDIKFTAFGLQTYEDWEQSEKEKCWDVLDVQPDEDLYAQACGVILYHKTYDIYTHPRGLRMYESKVIDEPDLDLNWFDRVDAIGAALRKVKIVAHGILDGNRIEEFVANPAAFAERKVDYRWNNISRGANKTLIRKSPEQLELDTEVAEVAATMADDNSNNDAFDPLLAATVSTQPQQAAGAMQTPATTVASSPSVTSSSGVDKKKQKKRTAAEALSDDEEDMMDIEEGPPARRTRASKKAKQGLVQGPPPPAKMT
ncbi:hypothetical protein LTR95_005038 [Oleoguttula sp. CCFEE 5521]